jgi:hypothetical protein
MPVTGACAEVLYLTTPEDVESDPEGARSDEEVVTLFRENFAPLPEDRLVDVDVDDNVF